MRAYRVTFWYGTDPRHIVDVRALNPLHALALATDTKGLAAWCDDPGFRITIEGRSE